MSVVQTAIHVGERIPWPDAVTRTAIGWLVGRTQQQLAGGSLDVERRFAQEMAAYPIAVHTTDANAQHYEIPAEFFGLVLGPQRKYSCCLYEGEAESLASAEERALQVSAEHAELADGQRILELGCGWGSLSLWMARHYPAARITSVSNSRSQRAFIMQQAMAQGLSNLDVVTADMNAFATDGRFDRVVSVEMFEHMANWRPLLRRVRDCLEPDGRLFVHVFSHSADTVSLLPGRQGRLDRAALLHRRHHAEPWLDPAVRRLLHGRIRMALERPQLSAHGAGLAGEL